MASATNPGVEAVLVRLLGAVEALEKRVEGIEKSGGSGGGSETKPVVGVAQPATKEKVLGGAGGDSSVKKMANVQPDGAVVGTMEEPKDAVGSWAEEVQAVEDARHSEDGDERGSAGSRESSESWAGVAGNQAKLPMGAYGGAVMHASEGQVGVGGDFFKQHVNTPRVLAFKDWLEKLVGVKVPKAARGELALASYSLGTVPAAFTNGQERLRTLAALGDAAMSLALVSEMYRKKKPVSSVQNARSALLSNTSMVSVCTSSGLIQHVVFPSGVAPNSKTSGEAVEAVAGVLYLWRPFGAVVAYVRALGLLKSFD